MLSALLLCWWLIEPTKQVYIKVRLSFPGLLLESEKNNDWVCFTFTTTRCWRSYSEASGGRLASLAYTPHRSLPSPTHPAARCARPPGKIWSRKFLKQKKKKKKKKILKKFKKISGIFYTLFENYSKCRIWIFQFCHFTPTRCWRSLRLLQRSLRRAE